MSDFNGPTRSRMNAPEPDGPPGTALGAWWKLFGAIFVGGLVIMAICSLLYDLRQTLLIFAVGYIVAYLCEPVVIRLQRLGWSRLTSVWVTIISLVIVVSLLASALVPVLVVQAQDAATNWPEYTRRADDVYRSWRVGVEQWLGRHFPGTNTGELLNIRIRDAREWLVSRVPAILQWLSSRLLASVGAVGIGLIVLVLSFHFMMLRHTIANTLRNLIPADQQDEVSEVGSEIATMLGAYVRTLVLISGLIGAAVWAVLSIVGTFSGSKYALAVGVGAAIVHLVPYVGIALTTIAGGFLTYVTAVHSPFWAAIAASVGILLVDQAFDFIVRPHLIGRRINLHPLVVLFAIFVGYELYGFIGMLVAIPVAASVKIGLAKWVPVIGPAPGVHAPTEPLVLDLGRAAEASWKWVQKTAAREFGVHLGRQKTETEDQDTDVEDDRPDGDE